MKTNEFEKGIKFSFNDSIQYAENAIVSKQILKKNTGNVSLFAIAKDEGLSEHTTPFDAIAYIEMVSDLKEEYKKSNKA